MKKTSKTVKLAQWLLFAVLIATAEFFLVAPFFINKNKDAANAGHEVSLCRRVVSVLENHLRKIGEDGEAPDYLDRAKILNRLSLEACDEEARRRYFSRALAELQVAEALRMLGAQASDASQKMGFYWKERAEFFRMHQMTDNELDIYEKYLAIPGRSRDVYSLVKKAEIFVRVGRLGDAVQIYADVADACRPANNSNCYVAGAKFADLLEESADNQEIIGELRQRWAKEEDFRDLFKYNRDAAARIKNVLK
ncbi:MAG: hypothetical protein LBT45_01685 [Rickettsiales bacterium]|jgi:hypothetical protein|nr:hypothetical protein [Rickettsiales bacterium]